MGREAIERYLRKHGYERWEPKAALLDMDGTLYESMSHHARAWKIMADENGLPADEKEFYWYEGRTGASTINLLFNRVKGRNATDEEVKSLYARKSALFSSMPPVEAMPGAKDLLDFLKAMGLQRVLVTGSGQSSLINRLDTDFPGIFSADKRITAANTTQGKPHPDPYIRAQVLAQVAPWQSVAFENAPLGVESAMRSGAFTVAVSTGPIPAEELWKAGADIVYDSMPQCAKEFPNLLSCL